MLATSLPFDQYAHSRPASAASNSPFAAQPFMASHDELYFQHARHPQHAAPSHTRHSSGASQSTSYSLNTNLHTPADSPPSMANYKNHISRSTHIRRARAASSPYGRDDGMLSGSDSLRSSSSEAEDMAAFFAQPDYGAMFADGPAISPEAMQAAAGFGQMTLGPAQQLEQLAANVRAATTTSASDRAKQIFVQAWFVPPLPLAKPLTNPRILGLPPTMPSMRMGTFPARASIIRTGTSAMCTASPTSTLRHSARPFVCASPPSRPGVWA
jgi:hypothetical protein